MKLLVKGATYLVRAADRIERDCDLLVEGNRIAGVGRYEPQPGWQVIDAAGCAVIPGLVNAHTHLYQNFLKGLNDGLTLVDWCDEVLFPAADVIHADHRRAGDERLGYAWSLAAALEMIKSGTTCCINMDMTMDAVFQAWLDIGFRGVGAITLVDQWIPDEIRQSTADLQRQTLGYVERWHQVPAEQPAHPDRAGALRRPLPPAPRCSTGCESSGTAWAWPSRFTWPKRATRSRRLHSRRARRPWPTWIVSAWWTSG